ncbi:MAG: putative glycoside hydrolase [Gaiellaceae bacterium]
MLLEPLDPNEQFRSRRRQARRRRAIRRTFALGVVALAAAGTTLGARFLTERDSRIANTTPPATTGTTAAAKPKPEPRPYPSEIRGVHVTMALASVPGKIDEYLDLVKEGLNTLELDVKDENGEVAFRRPRVDLARKVGAARNYYDPKAVVRKVRARGVYLIGRIVCFEDPILAENAPRYAIRTADGGVWRTASGLGWTNPYDKRVWKYNVDLAEAAAKVGFDEIQFDYVRFPTDGDLSNAVFNGKTRDSKTKVVTQFIKYARERLKPLGVRIGADVFGLTATRNMGIGQQPKKIGKYLDTIYPMVYPSHFGPGEYNLPDPNAQPGRTVGLALRDFDIQLRGLDTRLVPWLQDFSLGRTYTIDDVRGQIQAARDAGAQGYMLWNAAGVYTPGALAG